MSDPASAPPDLSFVATDDLLAELSRRFAATLFAAEREAVGQPDKGEFFTDYRGGLTTCIGLAARSLRRLTDRAGEPTDE